jgi:hypothetical protein
MEEQLDRIEEILKSLAVAQEEKEKALEAYESVRLIVQQSHEDVNLLEESLRRETRILLNLKELK